MDACRNQLKGPSASEMYEIVHLDMFSYDSKVPHILEKIPLPKIEGAWDEETRKNSPVPEWLVVNFLIPNYAPAYLSTVEDGKGYSLVVYFHLPEERLKQLMEEDGAAVRLYQRFVKDTVPRKNLHPRFKCIPVLVNINTAPLHYMVSVLVKKKNGKPFLTGPRCHTWFEVGGGITLFSSPRLVFIWNLLCRPVCDMSALQGPNYLQVSVDFHRFCRAARHAGWSAMDNIKDLLLVSFLSSAFMLSVVVFPSHVIIHSFLLRFCPSQNVGFVVEGHTDDELPERIVGCLRLNNLDLSVARPWDEVFPQPQKS